ncbi:MAG TPA: hypothetical protein VMV29_02100 [Ktedonobacterales bacterium]|nr:hypothetical protein [Ktedonobacterales bacterium]
MATPEPDNTPPSRSAASFLTRQLNALIRAYRLPVSQDPPAERTPRRRGRPRRDYPLSDEYFAEQISALYLRRHSEDPLRQGVISPSQFNRLRRGSASDTSTERAQAIAEFFGVDLSYLKPTLASSVVSAPGAETNTSASRANTPLAGPRASAISSISSSAFQSLSNDLAARGERVFVIVDDVAQPLNHLSAEQLTLLAHRIEDALMVARRALGEFAAPTVPDPGAPTDAPVPLRSSAAAAMPDARSEQPEQRTEPSEGVSPLQPATP